MEKNQDGQPIGYELKQEIMLYLNQRLFQQGIICKELYERATEKIVRSIT